MGWYQLNTSVYVISNRSAIRNKTLKFSPCNQSITAKQVKRATLEQGARNETHLKQNETTLQSNDHLRTLNGARNNNIVWGFLVSQDGIYMHFTSLYYWFTDLIYFNGLYWALCKVVSLFNVYFLTKNNNLIQKIGTTNWN